MKPIPLTRTTAFIYKFCIVSGLVCLFGPMSICCILLILSIWVECLSPEAEIDVWLLVCQCGLISGIVFGFLVFLFPFIFDDPNGIMSLKKKVDKYALKIKKFDEFYTLLSEKKSYTGYAEIKEGDFVDYQIYIYAREKQGSNLALLWVIHTDEITDDILNSANDKLVELVETHYDSKIGRIAGHITVNMIVCVNRITSAFRKMLQNDIEQDFKAGRFICGVSFGGKKMYIPEEKTNFMKYKYKKIRKDFMSSFNFLFVEETQSQEPPKDV